VERLRVRAEIFVSFLLGAPDLMPFLQENIGHIRDPEISGRSPMRQIAQRLEYNSRYRQRHRKSRVARSLHWKMRHLIQRSKVVPSRRRSIPETTGQAGEAPDQKKVRRILRLAPSLRKNSRHLKTDRYSIARHDRLVSNKTRLSYDAWPNTTVPIAGG